MRTNVVQLRRRIGYVIQNVGLFPHETVSANVATVPKLLGWDRKRIAERVAELLTLVGLEQHANRYPSQLSGGQRQRVGVARALAADPPVLLMDEPFGAVDPIVRERLQGEFLRLMQEVDKTVLFVTHDLDEAVLLGDKVAVFSQGGHLEQYDAPPTILGAPATPFVADFVGSDRGLKRLSVTPIDVADLEHPPVVHLTDRLADATASLRAAGARWAVVLDDDDALHGWIAADAAEGADRQRDGAQPGAADGRVGSRRSLPEAGVQRDAAARRRLGGRARRRPLPRGADAGRTARGAAPVGRVRGPGAPARRGRPGLDQPDLTTAGRSGSPRKRRTSRASARNAFSAAGRIGSRADTVSTPALTPQVATARPPTRATGWNMPLDVTT